MKDFTLYKDAPLLYYIFSIAATWIWAPALFVSSNVAAVYGLSGLLMFLLPNTITLILFSFFASYVRERYEVISHPEFVANIAGVKQSYIHKTISILVLVCSTLVQYLGLYNLLLLWGINSKLGTSVLISLISLVLVYKNGLKSSIITDYYKYLIMLIIAVVILLGYSEAPSITSITIGNISEAWKSFGITTCIGLLAAPYVDQTFWQRVFSLRKEQVKPAFIWAAIAFCIVPLCFGLFGLSNANIVGWSITSPVYGLTYKILISVCISAALLSTIDSNLCALSSMTDQSRGSFGYLLIVVSMLFCFVDISITALFLLYGTLRTCIAVPTILIVLRKFDKTRLFVATLLSVVLCPIGYAFTDSYWFTIGALLIPMIGCSNNLHCNYGFKK